MHKLLQRQLRRHLPGMETPPPEWQALLDSVSAAYEQADADRLLLERSSELMSQELMGRNERLREEQATLRSFMDSAPFMMALVEILEDDIRFLAVNPALARFFSADPAELVGRTSADTKRPLARNPVWVEFFHQIATSEGPVSLAREYRNGLTFRSIRVTGCRMPTSGAERRPRACFLAEDVTDELRRRQLAKEELERAHKQLIEAARQAGMAEVAVGVLHNVGNVLNSVNVSSTLLAERLRKSRADNLGRMAALLRAHRDEPGFWAEDPRAQLLPDYLERLAERLGAERAAVQEELALLQSRIDHIREIVAMQQSHATASGTSELFTIEELIDSAMQMSLSSIERDDIRIVYEIEGGFSVAVEKHKLLQILINLIRNACWACREAGRERKAVTVRARQLGASRLAITVIDNGIGISADNLKRLFSYGFTTRVDGHGFGLHGSSLAARQLGGTLSAYSDGLDRGAAFTLELPLQRAGEPRIKQAAQR